MIQAWQIWAASLNGAVDRSQKAPRSIGEFLGDADLKLMLALTRPERLSSRTQDFKAPNRTSDPKVRVSVSPRHDMRAVRA